MKNILLVIGLTIQLYTHAQLPRIYNVNDQIIIHNGYTLSYNESSEQANWVKYKITYNDLLCNDKIRLNNFRIDTDIETGSSTLKDYKGTGYDRGHLKPSGDCPCDTSDNSESFLMSNISPQNKSFNRGIWRKLENRVRYLVTTTQNDSIIVYTGGVSCNDCKTIGESNVIIPNEFFKLILIYNGNTYYYECYILKNEKSTIKLSHFLVSKREFLDRTKITFVEL